MPLRYIGAILIFLSCGGFGFMTAANCRRETRYISELIHILEIMENELTYRLTPLPQICALAAQETAGPLKAVFSVLSQELENQIAPDAAICMQAALTKVREISPQLRKMLESLGNSLGKYDLGGQLNEICAVKQLCSANLERMQTNQDVRLRSYQTLGLCVGAGLAILFL